ncbi:MAG: type I-C CRISPR-associated endonuclease Cas1c [Collinsella sp.]|nr:type I-C CRISPR-associated endonuclease Cas1c [Collinsella sp.]
MKRLLNTLYVTNPDAVVRKQSDAISVRVEGRQAMSVPFHVLEQVVLLGHVGCSMSLLAACAKRGVGVTLLDEQGRFSARVEGPVSGNVLLRREQYRRSCSEDEALPIAKRFVMGKLHNSRIVLQHYVRDYPELSDVLGPIIASLQSGKGKVREASSLDELRGVEGDAAHGYISVFGSLLRTGELGPTFTGRSRRPPKDPVNACLSFSYTMLSRDCASACESVGLDPQMGFLHACRPGRASLALDLMEELRSPCVDRFVLSLFNRKQLSSGDFRCDPSGGYSFTEKALKTALGLWQERKQAQMMHPFLKEKIPFGLLPFAQAQLLARYLRGDLNDYPACMWR